MPPSRETGRGGSRRQDRRSDDLRIFILGIDLDGGGEQVLDAGEIIAVGGVGPHHQPVHVEGGATKKAKRKSSRGPSCVASASKLWPVADAVDVVRQVAQVQAPREASPLADASVTYSSLQACLPVQIERDQLEAVIDDGSHSKIMMVLVNF